MTPSLIPLLPADDGPFDLSSVNLGALPIIDSFFERLDMGSLLERYLPAGDARVGVSSARVIGVVVRNLCVSREPLYGLASWCGSFDPPLLGLAAGDGELLNDDRVGRALDQLFDADRASLLCELVLGAISEFKIDCTQLHNDSTSITLHGSYAAADGRPRGGKATVVAARGHSKDHRPDLKQLLVILTVSADGAIPMTLRLADGNTTDDTTHIASWDELRRMLGRVDFLYVADSKLCTTEQMRHICVNGGRFVTVLPRTRREHARLRTWMSKNVPEWTIAERRKAKRSGEPGDVWRVATPPLVSAEGYRLVWVHSSAKHRRDEQSRADRIERAQLGLDRLNERLKGPRTRIKTRVAASEAADAIVAALDCERYLTCTVNEHTDTTMRQATAGRPGPNTKYVKTTQTHFQVDVTINDDKIRHDAASDGCFPLISNDHDLTDTEIFAAYRYQPNLEKRHHELKSVQDAAPVTLQSAARIEALFACQFLALLCRCLIERELRQAMAHNDIKDLPLYHEDRSCTAPTAARVFDTFNDTSRHQLTHHGNPIQTFQPELTTLQRQLLTLLNVPERAYTGPT